MKNISIGIGLCLDLSVHRLNVLKYFAHDPKAGRYFPLYSTCTQWCFTFCFYKQQHKRPKLLKFNSFISTFRERILDVLVD